MLDIGFSELFLIAVAALVLIGPKDLPVVFRHAAKFMREMRGIYKGIKGQMTQLMDEAGIEDFRQEMTTIIDLEGKPQKAYNVADLESLRVPVASAPVANNGVTGTVVPPTSGGRLGGGLAGTLTATEPPPQPSPEWGGGDVAPLATKNDA